MLLSTARTIKQTWHVAIFGSEVDTGQPDADRGLKTIALPENVDGIFQIKNNGPHDTEVKIDAGLSVGLPVGSQISGIVANSISIKVLQVADKAVCIVEADFLGSEV